MALPNATKMLADLPNGVTAAVRVDGVSVPRCILVSVSADGTTSEYGRQDGTREAIFIPCALLPDLPDNNAIEVLRFGQTEYAPMRITAQSRVAGLFWRLELVDKYG